MTDELKQVLTANKPLLVRNDFDGLYKKLNDNRQWNLYKELTEFLYNIAKIDPLKHMKRIPKRMFNNVVLNGELIVPKNISFDDDNLINGLTAPSVRLDCDITGRTISNCRINRLVIASNVTKIPSRFLYEVEIEKLILPESVVRIGSDAFNEGVQKIITPYRDSEENRLVIPKSEISWYKDHLRFTHAPKESEAEDAVKAN